jgi:GTP:adenosylcobinamide-phosphate guanylyltransferase
MNSRRRFTVLVMAASRGAGDPVATGHDLSHKCLVPVAGETMLGRVLGTLDQSPRVGRVAISIESPDIINRDSDLAAQLTRGNITVIPSAASPCASVLAALDDLDDPWPVLVTTADHPLLSPAMVDHFCDEALVSEADVAVALASASCILANYPDTKRTFLPFRGERYSGCNLFALMTPRAARAVDFWRRLEIHRKHPWRLFRAFGPMAVIRFMAGGMTLAAAFAAASRRLDVAAAAITMPFAEAAIDVDKPDDLALVEKILRHRK